FLVKFFQAVRVSKNLDGFLKTDTVLVEVQSLFLQVPFESHSYYTDKYILAVLFCFGPVLVRVFDSPFHPCPQAMSLKRSLSKTTPSRAQAAFTSYTKSAVL